MGARSSGPCDPIESRVLRVSTELDPLPDTMGQAISNKARNAAIQLNGVVPDKVMRQNSLSGRPQGCHDSAPALTIGSCPRLGRVGPSHAGLPSATQRQCSWIGQAVHVGDPATHTNAPSSITACDHAAHLTSSSGSHVLARARSVAVSAGAGRA